MLAIEPRVSRNPALLAAVAGGCFLVGRAGLSAGAFGGTTAVVWPVSGFALALMLLVGRRTALGVFAGLFAAHASVNGLVATSAGLAAATTIETTLGAILIERFAGGPLAFQRAKTILRVIAIIAIVTAPIGATLGVASVTGWHVGPLIGVAYEWMTWWLAHLTATIVVTPFVVLWALEPFARIRWTDVLEGLLLAAAFAGVNLLVFGGRFPSDVQDYPLEFLCVPFLIWSAFRFGRRGTATAVLALSGAAIWGTLSGYGPFVRDSSSEALVLVHAYITVMAMTGLVLAAALAEHQQAEAQLRELATTDSLTGLANYRRLLEVLKSEIARSNRTKRAFAVVFIDMNGLKRINDRHGHLVGSRALSRLAEILRATVRTIDTPARFGGDEFAVVLPETGEDGGRLVLNRLADRVRADPGHPAISISGGVAIFPRDGESPTLLLRAADKLLYEAKAEVAAQRRTRAEAGEKTATLF